MDEGAFGRSRRGSVRGALANVELRKLLTALSVTWFGDWLYGVSVTVYVYDATRSAGWVAVSAVCTTLPYFLLTPYAGVLADRLPKLRLLVCAQLSSAGFMIALTFVALRGGPVLLVIVLATATSVAGTPNGPTIRALMPAVVQEDELVAANALTSVAENITVVAGPAVSVALLATVGAAGSFAANAVTFLVATALLLRLRVTEAAAPDREAGSSTWTSLRAGLSTAVGSAPARACLGFAVGAYALYGVDCVLFVVVATELLNAGTAGLGYLLAALGVGGILVVPAISRLTGSARLMRVLTLSTVVYALPTALLVVTDDLTVALMLVAVRGAAFVVIDVVTVTAMQRLIPSTMLGRVFAVHGSLVIGGATLGSAVVAPVLGSVGVGGALVLFGVAPTVVALAVHPRLRRLDQRSADSRDRLMPALECLERVDILAASSRQALERLAASAVLERAEAATVLVEEGAPPDAFFVVVSGRLAVISSGGAANVSVDLGEMGPGDCFGEIGIVAGRPRTATVTARTDCTLYRIPGSKLLAALNEAPLAVPAVLALAGGRLAHSHPGLATGLAMPPDGPQQGPSGRGHDHG